MEVPCTIGHPPYNVIPGFLKDVFEELKKKGDVDILIADCNAMAIIKASTTYNKTMGDFVDLGNEIVDDDENEVATEALVLMLVSLRKSWKYPIGISC